MGVESEVVCRVDHLQNPLAEKPSPRIDWLAKGASLTLDHIRSQESFCGGMVRERQTGRVEQRPQLGQSALDRWRTKEAVQTKVIQRAFGSGREHRGKLREVHRTNRTNNVNRWACQGKCTRNAVHSALCHLHVVYRSRLGI